MAKRLNMFILIMLMVSQTILGPLASTSLVFAEGNGNDDEGETEVNKDELKELLEDVAELEEADYSVESFEALKEATEDAEEVFENDEATQEEVDDAFDDVEEAVEELGVDKTALTTLLDDNAEKGEEDYTADSFAEFVDALTAGKNVVDDADATQKDVNDAETEIEKALDALKKQTTDEESSDTEESSKKNGDEEGSEKDSETKESNEDKITTFANGDEPKEITENIIDEIILKREDGSIYGDGDQLDPNEDLELGLEWSLPNDPMYVGGDTFTFQLPEQLAIYSEITGDLDDFGTFVVTTDGEVTFTFNDKINENSNVKGTFWVKTELDKQKVTSSTEELEFKINEDVAKKITINIKPEGGQAIHKEGQPVGGTFNTDEIEWTVLINTTKEALENAIVTDPIGDDQELDIDSIELQEIEVDLSGNEVKELGSVEGFTNDSTEEEINLKLGDTNKAYKLTFKTKIKDSEKDEEGWLWHSNTAYLNSDGKDEKESGAGVSVQRPESLTKTSSEFDAEDRSVEWTVNANFTEKQLKAGDTITDEFNFTVGGENKNDVFTVIEDNIKIEQVDSFDNNGNPTEKSDANHLFDINIEGNKVTYTLKEDTSSAFIIKYKTVAEDGAYINKNGEISNKVEIDGKTADSSQGVHQQVGDKWIHEINYETKEIEWKIRVNADKQDLKNFILTDNFSGAGQKLVENSIDIDPDTSGAQISPDADGEGFKINFGDIKDTYLITYKTEFTYDFADEDKPNFKNGLNIKYDTGDPDNPYELEIEREREPNEETRNNGVKNGTANNETKEITWTVDVNYNNLTLTDAKVIDEIADNQSLIEGSVKVYEISIDSGGDIKIGDEVTENFDVTAEENLVEVLFNGEIDQSHRIEFKTKDKDDIYNSDEVYENTAQFIPREGEEHNLKATVTLPNQGEFLGKSGLHNKDDWTVDWKIDVNQSQSKLNGVTVKDDLGDDGSQILLEDSFKVTKAGSDEELDEEAYELTIDGNAFSIKFDGEITDAYEITYSSYILAGETADLKNEAEIESVEEEIVGNVEKEEVVEVKISTGGGTAEGATGGLTLEKTEKDTGRTLEDVKFTLLITIGGQEIVVREDTTDEEGKIEWVGLRYGDYTLKEELPEGYTGEESQEVTIDNDSLEDGVRTLEIVNERQTGIAKIIKIDAVTGEELPGAAFEITNETTGQKYTLTTEDDGTISEEVPYGEYTVEEVTAPNGYRIIEDIDNITIEVDETTEITIENEAFVDVDGEKTWVTSEDEESLDSITVELLTNGTKTDEQEVSASDDWKYSFTNLDKYDEDGEEIEYTIEEIEIAGYEADINGFDITNLRVGTVSVEGEKTWLDDESENRPGSINVNLSREVDGEIDEDFAESKPVEPNEEGEWKYEFKDLAEFDENGAAYTYKVEEADVPANYESNVKGYDITNVRIGETEVSGTKHWKDDTVDNRPEKIEINLLRNDVVVDTKEVTADEDWKYTFTELAKYDDEGQLYEYTVKEQDVAGYNSDVKDTDITNTRAEKKDIEVNKAWLDDESEERPESIVVYLKQNGANFDTVELKAENDWKYEFTDLEAFDENGHAYSYSVEEKAIEGYETTIDGFDIQNLRVGETEVSGTKTWLDDDSEDRPEEITVKLLANGEETDQTVTVDADSDWTYEFTGLDQYDDQGKEITYTVEEEEVEGYETSIDGFDITNLRVGKTEVTGEKIWDEVDERYRPDSITVQLLANGEPEDTFEVSDETDWSYGFTGLEKYDDQGKEIVYTVQEPKVPAGYDSEVDGYIITNTQQSTEVSGEKKWEEVDERYRPDTITVQLLANGEEEATVEVSAESDWTYEFTDLAKYDKSGKEIEYTVEELEIPTGYTAEVDGFDITNTQASTEVAGEKTWNEVDDRYRSDSITVQLLANGEKETTIEVSAETDWEYAFTDLAQYDKSGEEITYAVKEIGIPTGYESEVDGFNITNTQETTKVSGEKKWDEVDSQYRPDSIIVQLLANGEEEETVEVSNETDWIYEFTDLAKYDKDGKEIDYTVEELDVPAGYESEVDGYTITNTQKSTEISGTKTWLDDNSEDRPEVISVQLKNGEEVVDQQEVTAEEQWEYTFTDLAKYDKNGEKISYTVDEVAVDGYEKSIAGNDITNLRVGTTEVDITKLWKDEDEIDRPDTITVNLLQNGIPYKEYEVTKDNDWELTITELPKYDKEGKIYEYSVTEHDVPGYAAEIAGFEIINTRADFKTIEITKSWLDDDSKDRPDSIEVELFRSISDGEKELVDTYTVTADDDWSLEINDLDAYDPNGNAYTYEVNELTVEGYETIVNGFDITNLRVGTTSVEGTKTWEDGNSEDRPSSIIVELLQNGEKIDEVEVTAGMNWKFSFTDLEEFDENGVAYVYTVAEQEVAGYTAKIDGYDITNTLIETPSKDEESDHPGGFGQTKPKEDTNKIGFLPKTATNTFNLLLAGALLLVAGTGFILFRRRKAE